jgi:sulfur relay (sulfurtransferase) DsrC/TusE family protein
MEGSPPQSPRASRRSALCSILPLALALTGLAIVGLSRAQAPSATNAPVEELTIRVVKPGETNIVVYTNNNTVLVITNIVPAVVVTNKPPPTVTPAVTNVAAKPAAPVFPPDKEIVVVAAGDCNLMLGSQKLATIPPKTILVAETLTNNFANVSFGATNGWVPLAKCIPMGRSPPEADIFCLRALRYLNSNDVQQAQANLFIASALEPADRSYPAFLDDLAKFNETLKSLVAQHRALQEATEDADRQVKDASFLKQKVGLDDKAKERREEAGKDKEAKAKAAKEAVGKQQEKFCLDVRSYSVLFSNRLEALKAEGNYHMAVALDDYRAGLSKDSRYTMVLATTNFLPSANLLPIRTAVATSFAQYEAGVAAMGSNLLFTASRSAEASLKAWPQNRTARRMQDKIKEKMQELDQLRQKIQQLKQTNDVLGLEIAYATVGNLTKDFEKLDEQVAENRKILVKAREILTSANQSLDEQRPFECDTFIKQASTQWKLNPDIKGVSDRFQEKYAEVAAALAKVPAMEKELQFAEVVKLLQGFQAKFDKDPVLGKMLADYQAKQAQSQEELKKAQALEKANKTAEAFEIYAKWNVAASLKRLGRALGKDAEAKGQKDKAISYYERAGLQDDLKRLRPNPLPPK